MRDARALSFLSPRYFLRSLWNAVVLEGGLRRGTHRGDSGPFDPRAFFIARQMKLTFTTGPLGSPRAVGRAVIEVLRDLRTIFPSFFFSSVVLLFLLSLAPFAFLSPVFLNTCGVCSECNRKNNTSFPVQRKRNQTVPVCSPTVFSSICPVFSRVF